MIIDISEVLQTEGKEITEEVTLAMTSFASRLGDFPIQADAPFLLTIANEGNRRLLLRGHVELEAEIACARCLEEVPTSIRFDIDKELVIRDGSAFDEEMEQTDYLIGFELDADKLVCAEILVNWPMKVLCREDCKGICRVCGINLNHGTCSCQKTEPDPRMAAIQDIFQKFKELPV